MRCRSSCLGRRNRIAIGKLAEQQESEKARQVRGAGHHCARAHAADNKGQKDLPERRRRPGTEPPRPDPSTSPPAANRRQRAAASEGVFFAGVAAISQPQHPAPAVTSRTTQSQASGKHRRPRAAATTIAVMTAFTALTASAIGICRNTALTCAARISSRTSLGGARPSIRKTRHLLFPKADEGCASGCGGKPPRCLMARYLDLRHQVSGN